MIFYKNPSLKKKFSCLGGGGDEGKREDWLV